MCTLMIKNLPREQLFFVTIYIHIFCARKNKLDSKAKMRVWLTLMRAGKLQMLSKEVNAQFKIQTTFILISALRHQTAISKRYCKYHRLKQFLQLVRRCATPRDLRVNFSIWSRQIYVAKDQSNKYSLEIFFIKLFLAHPVIQELGSEFQIQIHFGETKFFRHFFCE